MNWFVVVFLTIYMGLVLSGILYAIVTLQELDKEFDK